MNHENDYVRTNCLKRDCILAFDAWKPLKIREELQKGFVHLYHDHRENLQRLFIIHLGWHGIIMQMHLCENENHS